MKEFSLEVKQKAQELRIIDDALFRLVAARKEVCQEILRTLLDDDGIEVMQVIPQETITSLYREVTLDVLCRLSDGTYCNVEVQKGSSEDDVRRVRFHASMITSQRTPQGTDFKDIPPVKVLYITAYDALGNGQTVTPVKRCQKVKDKYEPLNDGEDILFANTEVKDDTEHTKLLQLFLRRDSFYDADYPALSEAMRHFKEDEEGVKTVCKIIEEYGTSEVRKAMEQVVVNLFHEGVPVSTIAKSAGITEEEALEIRDKALQSSSQHIKLQEEIKERKGGVSYV